MTQRCEDPGPAGPAAPRYGAGVSDDPDAPPRSRLAIACRRAALRGGVVAAPVVLLGAPLLGDARRLLAAGLTAALASTAASLPLLTAAPERPWLLARLAAAWGAAGVVLAGALLGGVDLLAGARLETELVGVALLGAAPFAVAGTWLLDEVVHARAQLAGREHPEPWTPLLLYLALGMACAAMIGLPALLGALVLGAAWAAADGLDRRLFPEDADRLGPRPGAWAAPRGEP